MSFARQKGSVPLISVFVIGLVAVTLAVVLYVGYLKPDDSGSIVTASPLPSPTPNPSPAPSASEALLPSPSSTASVTSIDYVFISEGVIIQSPEPYPEVFIEKMTTEKENGRIKITLEGKKFGDKSNQILLDNSVHNYGYTIISWNDTHIEFYGSEWVPAGKNITVAVINNSGNKSNTVSFFNN